MNRVKEPIGRSNESRMRDGRGRWEGRRAAREYRDRGDRDYSISTPDEWERRRSGLGVADDVCFECGCSGGSAPGGTPGFAGFISSTPFTSLTLSMPDGPVYNAIDNFAFGNSVPEPASVGLVAIAGLGLFLGRKKLMRSR